MMTFFISQFFICLWGSTVYDLVSSYVPWIQISFVFSAIPFSCSFEVLEHSLSTFLSIASFALTITRIPFFSVRDFYLWRSFRWSLNRLEIFSYKYFSATFSFKIFLRSSKSSIEKVLFFIPSGRNTKYLDMKVRWNWICKMKTTCRHSEKFPLKIIEPFLSCLYKKHKRLGSNLFAEGFIILIQKLQQS